MPDAQEETPPLAGVVAAETRGPFRVWLRFEDGVSGELDISPLLTWPAFADWKKDPAAFKALYIDPVAGTIAWPGNLDLCPDVLHDALTAGKPLHRHRSKTAAG